ncbi:bacteriocin [Methylobacterium sp. Leaf456]|nr:bacteriocin [Methylobacterium sp. Leaf456]
MKKLDTKALKTISGGTFCFTVKTGCNSPCSSKKSSKC